MAWASRTPDATAVAAPDCVLTYGQLERRANQLANHLRGLGVDRGSLVSLCLYRSAAMVVGALGILKAGGAYVALDPRDPPSRLGFMIGDCDASVIVTDEPTAARLQVSGATVVALDRLGTEPDLEATCPAVALNHAGDLAYVVYTSGSTGSPKGVLVQHSCLANLTSWHRRAFAITAADRATQIASPAFDAAVWELWPHLASGASVHVPPEEVRADPEALRDWLVAEQITVTFLPTALAELVMTLRWPSETRLRFLLTGGESLQRHPPAGLPFAVINNYGPAEATVVTTSGPVPPGPGANATPSIGLPIDGVRAYVVDEQLDPVATGETGELLIGGPGVASGYLGQARLTAEKFIPDPFTGIPGARLYRTGDYVRQRPGGELEFRGRRDDQVQLRGNRVELGEISAALRRHPAVRSSVVVLDGPGSVNPRLIAYVVADEPRPDVEQLRTHLAGQLPSYMMPSAIVYLEELPLTANGKVDRSRLCARSTANGAGPTDSARPRNEPQSSLETIVSQLLELDQVGMDENFFLIGGHSLLGAQLLARIRERFGVEMTLRSLFDNPTVAGMALEVERLLVAELEAMSDADAARLLAAETRTSFEPGGDEPSLPVR